MNDRNDIVSMVLPYAIGILIGAGLALLMAPQSGRDIRSKIKGKSMEIKDRALNTVGDTRARAGRAVENLAEQTKENLTSIRNRGKEMIEENY
jgi:gas vesicle protein